MLPPIAAILPSIDGEVGLIGLAAGAVDDGAVADHQAGETTCGCSGCGCATSYRHGSRRGKRRPGRGWIPKRAPSPNLRLVKQIISAFSSHRASIAKDEENVVDLSTKDLLTAVLKRVFHCNCRHRFRLHCLLKSRDTSNIVRSDFDDTIAALIDLRYEREQLWCNFQVRSGTTQQEKEAHSNISTRQGKAPS